MVQIMDGGMIKVSGDWICIAIKHWVRCLICRCIVVVVLAQNMLLKSWLGSSFISCRPLCTVTLIEVIFFAFLLQLSEDGNGQVNSCLYLSGFPLCKSAGHLIANPACHLSVVSSIVWMVDKSFFLFVWFILFYFIFSVRPSEFSLV